MNSWALPTTLKVGGVDYSIRTDFRKIIKLFSYLSNPDYEGMEMELIMWGLYEHPEQIPKRLIGEALEQATLFFNGGEEPKKEHSPRLMDWEQDANLIIPAVNKVAGKEVRALEYMHWWTFLGLYMEIGEGTFNTVVGIRGKLAKGKKLEKWEREYYKEHVSVVKLQEKMTTEQKAKREADKAALRELLGD